MELMGLLALVLLASSILMGSLERKYNSFSAQSDFEEAEMVAEKINHWLSYVSVHRNSVVDLAFSSTLDQNYVVNVNSDSTEVESFSRNFSFDSRYNGDDSFVFNTSKTYTLSYDGGVKVE